MTGHEDDAPSATGEERSLGGILAAAALQGTVSSLVKTAAHRGGAAGTPRERNLARHSLRAPGGRLPVPRGLCPGPEGVVADTSNR